MSREESNISHYEGKPLQKKKFNKKMTAFNLQRNDKKIMYNQRIM
jgi:hypothetical protein